MSGFSGALNSNPVNGIVLNGGPLFVAQSSGAALNCQQAVGLYTSGTIFNFQQEVEYRLTSSGAALSFESIVNAKSSGAALNVDQEVIGTDPGYYTRNGFYPTIFISGKQIEEDELTGVVSITYTEGDNPRASFSIKPSTGTQDLRRFRGKECIITVRESSGRRRLFTGRVDTPTVDVIGQRLMLTATLDREQYINDNLSIEKDDIGFYSVDVFGQAKTTFDEVQDRMSTIPETLDFDVFGNWYKIDVRAKASPDYTLANSDVRRDGLQYQYAKGQRVINKVVIKGDYLFNRLHHHQRSFTWTADSVCSFIDGGWRFPSKEAVLAAPHQGNWVVQGAVSTDVYAEGWYTCPNNDNHKAAYLTHKKYDYKVVQSTDINGDTINDSAGNPLQEAELVRVTDYSGVYATSASWNAALRFSQQVKEAYTLTVNAPQSTPIYGTRQQEVLFSLQSEYDVAEWENREEYSTTLPAAASGTSGNNYWIDYRDNVQGFNDGIAVLLNQAKSEIIKSHRDDKVIFKKDLWTAVSLKDTVTLNTTKVSAKGKVYSYTHEIHIDGAQAGEGVTTVTLALSASEGSTSDTALTLSTVSKPSPTYQTGVGANGNDYIASQAINIKYPDITGGLRNGLTIESTASYNVSIPDDTLSINFNEGS